MRKSIYIPAIVIGLVVAAGLANKDQSPADRCESIRAEAEQLFKIEQVKRAYAMYDQYDLLGCPK